MPGNYLNDPELERYLLDKQRSDRDLEQAAFQDTISDASAGMMSVYGEIPKSSGPRRTEVVGAKQARDKAEKQFVYDYLANKRKGEAEQSRYAAEQARYKDETEYKRKKDKEESDYKKEQDKINQDIERQKLDITKEKAAKEKEPTSTQFTAANYGKRMEQAEGIFENLAEQGYDRTKYGSAVKNAVLGNIGLDALQDPLHREQAQAERNFVNATLRRESGAAISPSEFENAEKQYFPRPGDSPQILANKAANRRQVMAAMKGEAAGAYNKIETITPESVSTAAPQVPRTVNIRRRGGSEIKIIPGEAAIRLLEKKDENGQPLYEVAK
jgi:hypothetical protein